MLVISIFTPIINKKRANLGIYFEYPKFAIFILHILIFATLRRLYQVWVQQ